MLHEELTKQIIACAYNVHNTLGTGFLERVYENAMMIELVDHGFEAHQQFPVPVYYKNILVGDFYADIFVESKIVVEIKAVEKLAPIHEVQLVNYLKGTNNEIGLLINFGSSVTVKRKYRDYIKT
jgi:GxxExxY protein